MSIWTYSAWDRDIKRVRADVDASACVYCQTTLRMPRDDHELKMIDPRSVYEHRRRVKCCPTCGWWTVYEFHYSDMAPFEIPSPHETLKVFGAAGTLREFDLRGQSEPLSHIRQYLSARYDARFHINPKRFEEVVVSVYRDLGYDVQATGRTGDGGVDAVLQRDGVVIGVQVKRFRGRIEAEEIRSFAGALYLKNIPAGIYITTSAYTRGAMNTAASAETRVPIILVDAERFYHQLGITQRAAYTSMSDPSAPFANAQMHVLSWDSLKP